MPHICVFAESPQRLQAITDALRKGGFTVAGDLLNGSAISTTFNGALPLAIIVDVAVPSPTFIECLALLSSNTAIPAVVFTPDETRENIDLAVHRGIAAYVVNGFEASRIETIIHVAVARFQALQNLAQEISKKEKLLSERKVIERAKGILMEERGLTENDAFIALRKAAMGSGRSVIDVATQIIILAKFPLTPSR